MLHGLFYHNSLVDQSASCDGQTGSISDWCSGCHGFDHRMIVKIENFGLWTFNTGKSRVKIICTTLCSEYKQMTEE